VLREDRSWFRGDLKVNPNERLFMKFVSLRTKRAHQHNTSATPSDAAVDDFTKATVASHKIHTYAELRQQIHDDLRLQHPEWIEPTGESPMCDFYEARLVDLLGANARGLN
jgi:hypothetical protein